MEASLETSNLRQDKSASSGEIQGPRADKTKDMILSSISANEAATTEADKATKTSEQAEDDV